MWLSFATTMQMESQVVEVFEHLRPLWQYIPVDWETIKSIKHCLFISSWTGFPFCQTPKLLWYVSRKFFHRWLILISFLINKFTPCPKISRKSRIETSLIDFTRNETASLSSNSNNYWSKEPRYILTLNT